MFLIQEEDTEFLPESLAAREPVRERDYQGPEADASVEIDRLFSYFAPNADQIWRYHSAMLETSPLNELLHPNLLRAIGGATHRVIKSEGELAPWHESFCLGENPEPATKPFYTAMDL